MPPKFQLNVKVPELSDLNLKVNAKVHWKVQKLCDQIRKKVPANSVNMDDFAIFADPIRLAEEKMLGEYPQIIEKRVIEQKLFIYFNLPRKWYLQRILK